MDILTILKVTVSMTPGHLGLPAIAWSGQLQRVTTWCQSDDSVQQSLILA